MERKQSSNNEYDPLSVLNFSYLKNIFLKEYISHKENALTDHFIGEMAKKVNLKEQPTNSDSLVSAIQRVFMKKNFTLSQDKKEKFASFLIKNDLEKIGTMHEKHLEKGIKGAFISHVTRAVEEYARKKMRKDFIVNIQSTSNFRNYDSEAFPSLQAKGALSGQVCSAKYLKEKRFEILYNPDAEDLLLRLGIAHELAHLMCIIHEEKHSVHSHDEIFCSFLGIWILAQRTNFYKNQTKEFVVPYETLVDKMHSFHIKHKHNYKKSTVPPKTKS